MARLKSDYMMVMSFSILFGLLFWLVDGYFEYIFFHRNLKFLLLEGPETLADSLFIKVPMHSLFVRISFIAAACLGGILLSFFLYRKNLLQKKLHHLNNVLMAVRNVNQLIVKETDPGRLIEQACVNLTETMGYRNAWIALLGGEAGRTLGLPSRDVVAASAAAGFDGDFEAMGQQLERGEFPVCMKRALDTDNAVVFGDPASDCLDCKLSVDYGGRAALARRLAFDGVTYGVLTASVPANYARDVEEQDLFNEVAGDLAFTLHKIATALKLEETRDRFRLVFEAANVGKSITLPTGEVDVNKAFAEMLGYAPEELRNKTWQELTPPEDVLKTERHIAPLLDGREDATRFEKRYLRKDGGAVWTDVSMTIRRDSQNRPLHFITTVVDITDRKQAEKELAMSERSLASVIEQNPGSIWTSDSKGTLVRMNRACRELFGVTEPEVVGKYNILEDNLIEVQGHMPLVRGVFEKGMIARFTIDYDARDVTHIDVKAGKRRILDVVVSPIRNAQGKVSNAIVQHKDVTELKKAEEERDAAFQQLRAANQQLEASNQQLRATARQLRQGLELLDATGRMAKVGGWEVDAKTLEVKWTEQTYRLHEVPLDRRPPLEEAINFFHPEEQPELKDAIHRALEHGEPYDKEVRFITAKGNHLWTRTYCEPEIIDGKTVRLKGVFQDITDRKHAEEELRKHREHLEELVEERTAELRDLNLFSNTILDTSPVGIVTYRANGQCVSANENTGPLIGATREQVLGQNFRTLAPWRESELLAAADRCLETGEPQRALISTRTSFGKGVILDTRFARFMARGEPHLLLTFTDITDHVRAEEDLKRYSAQLEAANRELEAFAYSVSHDLRAPLRSINGFSEALLEDYADKVDEQGKDHLRRVRAGAQRMGELIEDLLKLSRITRWEMNHRKVDISALARQTVASLRESQPGRDVDVIIEDGLAAEGDMRLLRVVMENLLGNAWKFSGKTANARIEAGQTRNAELGTRNAELPDDAVVYFVRDNGAGFDMDYAGKLFGAFQRLHSTAEFEGSGIGLATVQRAVLRHGGRIWAEGDVGKGAAFYFTLT